MLSSVQPAQDTASRRMPLKVLIVDDDIVDRQRYLRFLSGDERNTFIVCEAATAEEGMRLLNEDLYDCVVLDYGLPDADGPAVLEFMRDGDGGPLRVPVVMTTGQGNESIAVEAMKLGVADYLRKDCLTGTEFVRAIAHAAERAHLRAALREKSQRLEQMNIELKRQTAEIQRFYHTVSHELKTPLTAAREFISLVIDGVAGPLACAEQLTYLGHAITACDMMARQVNDLLDAARLDCGKLQLNCEGVRVERAFAFAVAAVQQSLEAKGIHLSVDVEAGVPLVAADEARLVQIMANLMSNAVKYTGAGGNIAIEAQRRPGATDQVDIIVRDDGCGIASEHMEHIFDRLFQVPQGAGEINHGGLGLGLAIAKDLVERHHGQLTVESAVGAGTTFRFNLRAAAAAASDAAAAA